ncbi:aspartic peptidase domain-containing protein [Aspergillus undulatus]|uniref:aspartic peptidase domain-containing protein n=1 Tax=Aspergillus undulatus TaxID=1810928 RepID=UPI003CCCED22
MRRAFLASRFLAGALALNIPRDLRTRQSNSSTTSHTIQLSATLYGSRFHAPVTIGGETFNLLVDTGSSDTFVVEDDFDCVVPYSTSTVSTDIDLLDVDQDTCGYESKAYALGDSHSFERITNESFQAAYGAGIARGLMAFEDITFGDVTVTDQRFGLVNWSTPMNLGASGILGLAYPFLTSAYELNGTIEEEDLNYQGEKEPYSPLFVSMYQRGLVEPYFSLALDRLDSNQENGDGGVMVLGGVPNVSLSSNWTTVSAEYYEAADLRSANGTRLRSYWATTVERLTYGGDGEYTDSYQTIVDSGAPMNYVPYEVAEAYNDLYSPRGSWSDMQGTYIVDCGATAPDFSVQVGGTTFTLNPVDLILHTGEEYNDEELCLSTITRGLETAVDEEDPTNTTELYILGASFLKDVVAVFDFGNSQMRFAVRESGASALGMGTWGAGRFVVLGAVVVLLQGLI